MSSRDPAPGGPVAGHLTYEETDLSLALYNRPHYSVRAPVGWDEALKTPCLGVRCLSASGGMAEQGIGPSWVQRRYTAPQQGARPHHTLSLETPTGPPVRPPHRGRVVLLLDRC